ncbi:hypothetical protein BRADI_5g09716v3 [Brachypodium distachyon]|uniref:Uncharacterized protein n=1 Tax=Brachypodium distachyon TaxID=15368 RepID=A0A2K2CGA0_BRADI|nr:hypothetical protein BRADI_5g09716v3 [Brachypodium distachyon]
MEAHTTDESCEVIRAVVVQSADHTCSIKNPVSSISKQVLYLSRETYCLISLISQACHIITPLICSHIYLVKNSSFFCTCMHVTFYQAIFIK